MTLQSSFLLRCWLSGAPDSTQTRACQITHIQSGAEFRSIDPVELSAWINSRNHEYAVAQANRPADSENGPEEKA